MSFIIGEHVVSSLDCTGFAVAVDVVAPVVFLAVFLSSPFPLVTVAVGVDFLLFLGTESMWTFFLQNEYIFEF